jgi:acetyl esterase/lipase
MKKIFLLCEVLIMAGFVNNVCGKENEPNQVISLWPDQPKITLEVFLPSSAINTGTGIVVCPGGGYQKLCKTYEGYDLAEWLNSLGVAAFILSYHIAPEPNTTLYPWPMKDGRKAVSMVRSKAAEYGIRPNQIGIMGFSAGGHLASTIGTHWRKPDADDVVNGASCRPDFMVLLYPVISLKKPYCHLGSRENLIGKDANGSRVAEFSNELQVDSNTPPTFLVGASNDTTVPIENSMMFYSALRKAGVMAEMHIFSRGKHGMGMGFRTGESCDWRPACVEWMKDLKLIK